MNGAALKEETIKAFLIFEKRSGRPFINRIYPGFEADPFLLIGFLNAMIKFAKESMISSSDIKMIDMQDLRFAFMESKGIIFTVISSNALSSLDLEFKIKTIESLFFENFSEIEIKNPAVSIDRYRSFNPVVDEIIRGEVRSIPLEQVEKLEVVLKRIKDKFDEIKGVAIISFTGVVLINLLEAYQYELVSKIINSLFYMQISGINKFSLKTMKLSIYVELIAVNNYIVFVSDKDSNDLSANAEFRTRLKEVEDMLSKT